MKKTILLILLVLLIPKGILGQYRLQSNEELVQFNSIGKERVFLHYNDNLLLSGEYLYYKMYCVNNEDLSPTKISKIGYIELVGSDGLTVFKHKINLTKGLGQGDFFIPININTGHYKLVGYTNWMRNLGVNSFFVADIAIINPFKEIPDGPKNSDQLTIIHSKIDSLNSTVPETKKNTSNKIILPKKYYQKRELVKVEVNAIAKYEIASASISVRKKDSITTPLHKNNSISFTNKSTDSLALKNNTTIFLPELRGELISGKIINKLDGQPVKNQNISISTSGNKGFTKISQSNENGAFFFNLNKENRSNQLFFNIIDTQSENYEIILDTTAINKNSFHFSDIGISKTLNSLLEKRSIYNQIENAFFEQKSDSIVPLTSATPIYKIFDEVYNLDDYTRFSSLEETLIEILDNVLVKKRKGQYKIQIRENDHFFINANDTPLLLIDNILIQNSSDLFNYDVKKIQRIGIARSEYYIGPKKYQGIFSVETKEGNYSPQLKFNNIINIALKGTLSLKEYYFQDYSRNLSNKEHIADFRQQLLWLPNVELNENYSFEFYTSDNTGTYEISIEGFTENGKPISMVEYIYVE